MNCLNREYFVRALQYLDFDYDMTNKIEVLSLKVIFFSEKAEIIC